MSIVSALVKQRLSAAVEEIVGLFERAIAEYEEQLGRSKEENERQHKLLDALLKPQLRLHRADVQQLVESKQHVPPEQHEWGPSLEQEGPPEASYIKEEPDELWSCQEDEQLQKLGEAEIQFPFTPAAPVKSEEDDEEKPRFSDGEDCKTPDPANNFHPDKYLGPEDESEGSSDRRNNNDDHWTKTREPLLGFNRSINYDVSESDTRHNTRNKLFSCATCGKTFGLSQSLTLHMRSHMGVKPHCCPVCGKRFIQSSHVARHMLTHTGVKEFGCVVCHKRFTQKGNLNRHMVIHTGQKHHRCNVCGKRFSWDNQLRRHEEKCLGLRSSQLQQSQTEHMESGAVGEESKGPEPAGSSSLAKHSDDETKESSPDVQRLVESKEHVPPELHEWGPSLEQEGPPEASYIKEEQDELWSSQEVEQLQKLDQAENSDDYWTKTGEPLPSFNRPENHEVSESDMRHNTGHKPFSFAACGKTFGLSQSLTLHMRSHMGVKSHSCPVCGKRFVQSSHVARHMLTHTGVKEFGCMVCHKRFTQKGNLNRHMVVHTGQKHHRCNVCGKRFSWDNQLRRHEKKCLGLRSSQLHQSQTEHMESGAVGEESKGPEPAGSSSLAKHSDDET